MTRLKKIGRRALNDLGAADGLTNNPSGAPTDLRSSRAAGGASGSRTCVLHRRWAQVTRLPAVATPAAVSRGLALSYGCGAALTAATLLLPGGPAGHHALIWALVACAVLLSGLLAVTAQRFSRWGYHALVLCSWAMVTFGITTVHGQPIVMGYCLLYLLIITNAFLGCSWLAASAHLMLNTATVVALLCEQPIVTPAVTGVYAGTLVVMSVFVGRLVRAAADAEVDALTGLANRRGLDRRLEQLIDQAERGAPLSVAVMDLDHFKSVNDELGHAAGDDLLRGVARAWSQALPVLGSSAVLARAGGDEFVVAAGVPAEQLATWVHRTAVLMPAGASRTAGVAQHSQGWGASAVLARADEALYAAKRSSRGTVFGAGVPKSLVAQTPSWEGSGGSALAPRTAVGGGLGADGWDSAARASRT